MAGQVKALRIGSLHWHQDCSEDHSIAATSVKAVKVNVAAGEEDPCEP